MSRKTYIIVGIITVLALLLLAWFWFVKNPTQSATGVFGTAGNRLFGTGKDTQNTPSTGVPYGNNAGQGAFDNTNGTGNVGLGSNNPLVGSATSLNNNTTNTFTNNQDTGTQTTDTTQYTNDTVTTTSVDPLDTNFTYDQIDPFDTSVYATTTGTSTVDTDTSTSTEVTWLTRTYGGLDLNFNRIGTNQLLDGSLNGSQISIATVNTNNNAGGGGNNTDISSLLGLGVGIAACAIKSAVPLTAAGAGTAAAGVSAGANAVPGVPTMDTGARTILGVIATGQATQAAAHLGDEGVDFASCLLRGAARAAIQNITSSIVNWINSGFNGQPSFVQNYHKFFADTADKAAGEYIRGSSLSFLCSPFQAQVRIAIARSYAQRGNSSIGSCSLGKMTNNLQSFMRGNFSAGGWNSLLAYTTDPSNNAYGAYMLGQAGLGVAVNSATKTATLDLGLGKGFKSQTEQYGCEVVSGPPDAQGNYPTRCKTRITTPGTTIENSLSKTLGTSLDSLNLAKSFDEIINALVTQLLVKATQGLSNLTTDSVDYAVGNGIDEQATAKAQQLLADIQVKSQIAQSYGATQQGSISDIRSAQNKLQSLASCWNNVAGSGTLSAAQITQAERNASSTLEKFDALNTEIAAYNDEITKTNAVITEIQVLQTLITSASTAADVNDVQEQYDSDVSNARFLTATDVTTAQQNRQTLQSRMQTVHQEVATETTQCNAYGK